MRLITSRAAEVGVKPYVSAASFNAALNDTNSCPLIFIL
jgi:hypothetical protein